MGLVRIVGGGLRGRRIRVPDRGVRPTSERTREAIFDILGPSLVAGARVLDLYAGSGALGIEALSRGAAAVDFLEGSRAVGRMLEANLDALALGDRARVHVWNLDRAALPGALADPWDLVFLDPPYRGDAGARWLRALGRLGWPERGGTIVYERGRGPAPDAPASLRLRTERAYGDTTVMFYRAGAEDGRARGES